jgi:hypothetical protein
VIECFCHLSLQDATVYITVFGSSSPNRFVAIPQSMVMVRPDSSRSGPAAIQFSLAAAANSSSIVWQRPSSCCFGMSHDQQPQAAQAAVISHGGGLCRLSLMLEEQRHTPRWSNMCCCFCFKTFKCWAVPWPDLSSTQEQFALSRASCQVRHTAVTFMLSTEAAQ